MSELATSRAGGASPPNSVHAADAALMRAVAAGDRAAFERVYAAHQPRVFRLAYGVLLDRDEAREAVQEAFLKLHEAAGRWEPNAALGTWLYRVVLNHCLSLKRRLLRFGRGASPAGARPSPELAAVLGEAVGIVERSLGALPPRQRAVLTLRLDAELEPSAIAPLVGLTPNATRVALHRALERLRADLAAAGIDAPPEPEEAPPPNLEET
jgi:RNA polymerase sigma-70 factor (ECF subfamily)